MDFSEKTVYPNIYDASLLCAIPRAINRQRILGNNNVPFYGVDIWNAYELSWLRQDGCPQNAVLEIIYSSSSEYIIESKSLKLYLNSLNNKKFSNGAKLLQTIQTDLQNKLKTFIKIRFRNTVEVQMCESISGCCIDNSYTSTSIAKGLILENKEVVDQKLYSELLKSNCPLTGQPDWATVIIRYSGQKICSASLLQYIISLRDTNDYHEHCVEKIFMDIWTLCRPTLLTVYARYTRRGGIDINPFRSSEIMDVPSNTRITRQ